MEAMTVIVLWQLVFNAVECKASLIYAIAVAANDGAEVAVDIYIVLNGIMSEYNIGEAPVPVGNHERYEASAVIGDSGFHAVIVGYYIEGCRFAVDCIDELARVETGLCQCRGAVAAARYHKRQQGYGNKNFFHGDDNCDGEVKNFF